MKKDIGKVIPQDIFLYEIDFFTIGFIRTCLRFRIGVCGCKAQYSIIHLLLFCLRTASKELLFGWDFSYINFFSILFF
ncbi:MAG: hypothetical protein LBS50_03665 [Prevotellaceae bacterium]|jgi:hypothetical protein|nr:hypothetical protein [Prevotellaceae bacterium]